MNLCIVCGEPAVRRAAVGPVPKYCSAQCRCRAWRAKQPKPEPVKRYVQSPEERRRRARERAREYRKRNLDRIKAYRRENAEQIAAYQREYSARWRQENADQVRLAKRIDGIRRTVGKGRLEFEYGHLLRGDPCSYCDARCKEIDHIVPVAAGGPNDWFNFTAACKTCNARKRDKPLLTFLLTTLEIA